MTSSSHTPRTRSLRIAGPTPAAVQNPSSPARTAAGALFPYPLDVSGLVSVMVVEHLGDDLVRNVALVKIADGEPLRSPQGEIAKARARAFAAVPALLAELDVRVGDLDMLRRAVVEGDPKAELLIRIDDMLRETRAAIAKAAGSGQFPDAQTIARAIVEACRQCGENAEALARGNASRARHIAFDALLAVYPDASRVGLARCLGYRNPTNGASQLTLARRTGWWSEVQSDEVIGALVADRYGEQAG